MRMTRAAMRAQAQVEDLSQPNSTHIHEDSSDHELTSTEIQDDVSRPALRDITDEDYPQSGLTVTHDLDNFAAKKIRNKATMKENIKVEIVSLTPSPSVDSSTMFSDIGKSDHEQGEREVTEEQDQIHQDPVEAANPHTPIKQWTVTASKTPKFDPDVHASPNGSPASTEGDSFVDSIRSRSPTKQHQIESDFSIATESSLDHSLSRTSSTRKSIRIEDSVAEIDALEDAIEKFTENLPTLQPQIASPVKQQRDLTVATTPRSKQNLANTQTPRTDSKRTTVKASSNTSQAKTPKTISVQKKQVSPVSKQTSPISLKASVLNTGRSPAKSTTSKASIPPKPSTTGNRASPSKQPNTSNRTSPSKQSQPLRRDLSPAKAKSASTIRPSTVKPTARAPTKSMPATKRIEEEPARPGLSFSSSPVKQQSNVAKKRVTSGGVLSTSKPAFVPAKSSKPVTTSTFVLPGEAVAAKFKAQREERLAREQAELEKSKTFKARPVPKFSERPNMLPRENKASQARMSAIAGGSNKENMAPQHNRSSSSIIKSSALNVTKIRPISMPPPPKADSTAPRKPSAAPTGVSHARIASLSSGQRLMVTKEDAVNQKAKGKEVFNRARANMEQEQKEKREKEEAARKARAEAAERGRQASREWAEKQKKKIAGDGATVMKKSAVEEEQIPVTSVSSSATVIVS